MRRFTTVFLFELKSYMKNKAFIFSTVLLALVISLAMFAPRVFDMSEMLGTESEQVTEDKEDTEDEAEEKERYGLLAKRGLEDFEKSVTTWKTQCDL